MTGWQGAVWRAAPPAIVFASILLLIALVGGGWLSLGRADPLLAVPGAGWAAVAAALIARHRGWGPVVSGGIAGGVATLLGACLWAGSTMPWIALIVATATVCIAAIGAHLVFGASRKLASSRKWMSASLTAILLCGFAIGWQQLAWRIIPNAYAIAPDKLIRITILSSLPLEQTYGETVAARLHGEVQVAPVLASLRDQFTVRLIDDATASDFAETDVLLLAHPRALSPQSLVEIDAWVRAGGKAIILADGLSSWPPSYPLGDPRNPPVTSMLTPLLTHWGLRLDAPSPADSGLHVWRQGRHRLHLLSAGRFVRENGGCALSNDGIYGDCTIGAGRVLLLADADLLHGDLWYGTLSGRGAGSWSSGNALWLLDNVGLLAGRERSRALAEPVWVQDGF